MATLSTSLNRELMAQARASLRGNWTTPVLLTLSYFIFLLLVAMISPSTAFNNAVTWVLAGPVSVGFAAFYLLIVREQKFDGNEILVGFRQFVPALLTYLLMMIFIVLWMLLLIIPGLMAAYSYSMVFFVRRDQPELGPLEALARSKALMQGNRWKFCCLGCRFLGWALLAALTLGIGLLWVVPYYQVATVHFYEELLANEQRDIELIAS